MELVSTIESLSHHLGSFADQIDEIGSWIRSWDQDHRNKANIKEVDFGMTKRACLTIIANAQSVHSAIHLIDHAESIEFPELMARGLGFTASDWMEVLDGVNNADRSPIDHQCGLVLDVLDKVERSVRDFLHNKLEPLALSEKLGPQAMLAFQHFLFFHREHMKDAFLTLQGLMVQELNRWSPDLPFLVYRMEEVVSMIKATVRPQLPGLSREHQDHTAPDINSWAVPKR